MTSAFPKQLTANVTMSGANTLTTVPIPLQISLLGSQRDTVLVLEILQVTMGVTSDTIAFGVADSTITIGVSNHLPGAVNSQVWLQDSRTFAWIRWTSSTTTTGASQGPLMFQYNLTDHAGHGFLVASEQIFLTVDSNVVGTVVASAKILYRYRQVSVVDYAGLVQQQTTVNA